MRSPPSQLATIPHQPRRPLSPSPNKSEIVNRNSKIKVAETPSPRLRSSRTEGLMGACAQCFAPTLCVSLLRFAPSNLGDSHPSLSKWRRGRDWLPTADAAHSRRCRAPSPLRSVEPKVLISTLPPFRIRQTGGEGGIRTPGTLRLSGFQDRRNRPLCHLSGCRLPRFRLSRGLSSISSAPAKSPPFA